MLLKKSTMYIVEKDNPYHSFIIKKSRKSHNLKLEMINASNIKELNKLTTMGILESPTLYVCSFNSAPTPQHLSILAKAKLRERIIAIELTKLRYSSSFKYFTYGNNDNPIIIQPYDTWDAKEKFIITNILPSEIQIKDNNMYKNMVRLAITDTGLWNSIISLANYFPNGYSLSNEEIYEIFPNVEFVTLKSWVARVFIGTAKNITFKELEYFLFTKNYSPLWLLTHLQKEVSQLDTVYTAYRKGIVSLYLESNLLVRAETTNFDNIIIFNSIPKKTRNWCYSVIPSIPYPYFIQMRNIILQARKFNTNDYSVNNLYQLIIQIQQERKKYTGTIQSTK